MRWCSCSAASCRSSIFGREDAQSSSWHHLPQRLYHFVRSNSHNYGDRSCWTSCIGNVLGEGFGYTLSNRPSHQLTYIISKWYFDHIFKYFFSYLRALSPSSWGPSYCVSASLLFLSHCALNRIPLVLIKCHLIIDLPFLFFLLPIVFCDFRSLQFTCNERAVCIHSSWSSLNWTVNFHQLIRSLIMFYPIEINLTYM